MIKLVRIDHRLLHGQVIFSWTKQYSIDHIIVADDKVPNDQMTVMALTLAKPSGVALDIVKIAEVTKVIEKAPNHNYMILIKGPKEALALTEVVPKIDRINVGGVAKKAGSKPYGKAVYLTEEEVGYMRELLSKGVECFVQQVPSNSVEHVDFSK